MEDRSYPNRLTQIEFELDVVKEYLECYYGCSFDGIAGRGDGADPEHDKFFKDHMWERYDSLRAEYRELVRIADGT